MAKHIIKSINAIGEVVNADPDVRDWLKVVFFPDLNVTNAQFVYPAVNLSEQISAPGKEAGGTGNMKFALNGALTIGTLDGANVEIRDEVGAENFFLFGLTADQVAELRTHGYRPRHYYDKNEALREAIDFIASGALGRGQRTVSTDRGEPVKRRIHSCSSPITRLTSMRRNASVHSEGISAPGRGSRFSMLRA